MKEKAKDKGKKLNKNDRRINRATKRKILIKNVIQTNKEICQ